MSRNRYEKYVTMSLEAKTTKLFNLLKYWWTENQLEAIKWFNQYFTTIADETLGNANQTSPHSAVLDHTGYGPYVLILLLIIKKQKYRQNHNYLQNCGDNSSDL